MEKILELKNVSKTYNSFSLKNISFALRPGYIMGLVGPNGAGKTTIIKAILNAISIDQGEIQVFGLDLKKNEIIIKNKIGYIADSMYFSDEWTANEVSWIMGKAFNSWNREKFQSYLNRFGVLDTKKILTYSSGMKTKLMLASVLSRKTELLILDEPTSGLDPVMRDEFLALIKNYIQDDNCSVLYSTHITTDLEKAADYVTFINNGQLVFSKEIDELKEFYYFVKDRVSVLENIKHKCVGFRTNEFGFEALVTRENLSYLPASCSIHPASLDEIIVFSSLKGGE